MVSKDPAPICRDHSFGIWPTFWVMQQVKKNKENLDVTVGQKYLLHTF